MEQNLTSDIEFQNIKENLLNCDVYKLLKDYFNVIESKVNISIKMESTTTKNDINFLEKTAKIKLPTELIQLYLLYDKDDFGTFLGFDMIDRKDLINEFNDDKIFNQYPELLRNIIPNTVKNMDTNSKWIPFARFEGTYFAIDLDPDTNGKKGQIIAYGTDQDKKFVYADSFCEFLSLMSEYAKNNELFIENVFGKQMVFVKNNDLFHYIYDNNEEKRKQVIQYEQREKQIRKEKNLKFTRENSPEFELLDKIKESKELSETFEFYAKYRIIDFLSLTDIPIFSEDKVNCQYSMFLIGKDEHDNDYVLLNCKKVGYINRNGYCFIIANSIRDFLSLITIQPHWYLIFDNTRFPDNLLTFDNFEKYINEMINKFKNSENKYEEAKLILDDFINDNKLEVNVKEIYKNLLKALVNDSTLVIKYIKTDVNEEIIVNSGWSEETINMLKNAYNNITSYENMPNYIDFDFNFKLVIIDNLLYNSNPKLFPSFENQYQDILSSNVYKNESDEIIKENFSDKYCSSLYEYLKNLKITQEDLDKIETLYFDGGSQIYIDLAPNWNGESEMFDVKSIDGIQRLKNLKKVNVFSMMHKTVEEELKKLKYEVWVDDGKNSVHTSNDKFQQLLLDFKRQIDCDKLLSTALLYYSEFKFSSGTDKLIFNNDECNYIQKLFGKSTAGNDYVLLNNGKVGYVDHEGSCCIMANNIKDFFAILICVPNVFYDYSNCIDSFENFVKTNNRIVENRLKNNKNFIEYKKVLDAFLIKNNLETKLEVIYEKIVSAIITEPPLIMNIKEEKKSYFPTMPTIIDEYSINNEWIDDNKIQKLKEIYNNLINTKNKINKNSNSSIDIMSDNFKYQLGIIFDDKLKEQLIKDGFRDDKSFDFGLKQEYYTDDKLYLSFNTDSFEENANLVLDSIMILENNKENSFIDIKISDYNMSAKPILNDNNYKEVFSDVENIKKYVNDKNNTIVELWLDEYKIYKIVIEQISKEDVKNYQPVSELKTDPWVKENLNKVIFSDEKYGQFRLTGFDGEMLFSEKNIMFDKYEINDLEFQYYKPENHQIYMNTLNYVFDNEKEIIEKMYDFTSNICKEWGELDLSGNPITMQFIKTHFLITHITIFKETATVWGILIEKDNALLGGHNINANINFKTRKIYIGLEG